MKTKNIAPEDQNQIVRELFHNINNNLVILQSFLDVCEDYELDDLDRELLQNACKSYGLLVENLDRLKVQGYEV